jgi:hypothetical protein
LEEDAGIARRVAPRSSAGGRTVCERMEAVEAAAGTRAFEGALEKWKGFLFQGRRREGSCVGMVALHLYAHILLHMYLAESMYRGVVSHHRCV